MQGLSELPGEQAPSLALCMIDLDPDTRDDPSDLILGLKDPVQRRIPSRYSYSDEGSALYEELCRQPEYYLPRLERSLLAAHATEIGAKLEGTELFELGAGNSEKTALILDAILAGGQACIYCPVDVNAFILSKGSSSLVEGRPNLRVRPIVATYDQALEHMRRTASDPRRTRRALMFLGSSFGNFRPREQREFLSQARAALRPGELFLISCDLDKPTEVLTAAYNDRAGTLAKLELGVLRYLNALYDGDFDLDSFEHVAFHNGEEARIESHLRSLRRQTATLKKLGVTIQFEFGDTICNDVMYKPSLNLLEATFRDSGFITARTWLDEQHWYALVMLEAA